MPECPTWRHALQLRSAPDFSSRRACAQVTSLPLIVKLSPNVTDITAIARAEDAGADAVSLINTLLSMVIDLETRTPRLPLGFGAYQPGY